jgi:hypothetical protein
MRYRTRSFRKRKEDQASFRLISLNEEGKLFVFATNTDLKRMRKIFRKRWGIETSYRKEVLS